MKNLEKNNEHNLSPEELKNLYENNGSVNAEYYLKELAPKQNDSQKKTFSKDKE